MQQTLKFDRQFFRDLWQQLKPYWYSEERWSAFLLLALMITCIISQVRISVAFNYFRRDFFNALQSFNKPTLIWLIGKYIVLLLLAILVYGYNVYFTGLLNVRWRRWLTKRYLGDWLNNQIFYRMQLFNQSVDNPDQRISEDLESFPAGALTIFSSILSSVLTLIAFGAILWSMSGDLKIPFLSGTINIHGYLFWATFLYACLGTWLNTLIGQPLSNLNYLQQRYNANFRFSMARLREVSEQVAMYRGEKVENKKFSTLFKDVFDNFINIIKIQKRLVFFQNGYNATSFVFGLIIAMPLFFAKKIQIGGVVQITNALDHVLAAFSIFITLFATLAAWRSVIFRLTEFSQAIQTTEQLATATKIYFQQHSQPNLIVENLDLALPNGTLLLKNINLQIEPGETVLLSGQSGIGKSTLLRALAGFWPYGNGNIYLPAKTNIMFLPQKPYLPLGTLSDALLYPNEFSTVSDKALMDVLSLCGLDKLHEQLHAVRNWSHELSLGEQQLVAFARIFLQKPDWIFLDEATSALDEETEIKIHQQLRASFPNLTIVSVGHRGSLALLHERRIKLV